MVTGVDSCEFVDRSFLWLTADPRIHTNQHEKLRVIRVLTGVRIDEGILKLSEKDNPF